MKDALYTLGAQFVALKNPAWLNGSLRNHVKLNNLYFFLTNPKERSKNTRALINEIDEFTFDTVLCVENTNFSKWFFDYLRQKNPHVKIIMFLWDLVNMHHPRYSDFWPKFDKVYIFDRDDAQKYGFKYYPDFCIGDKLESEQNEYDMAFIGSMRNNTTKNRAFILHRIQQFCEQHGLKPYFRLKYDERDKNRTNPIKKMFRMVTEKKYRELIAQYSPNGFLYCDVISLEEVDRIFNQSRVLLDLGYPNRQGMTINCLTALAKGKKLITTNKRIIEEPFYDPANIYVIDENDPQLDIAFFNSPMKPVDLSFLRIDNWLQHILNS